MNAGTLRPCPFCGGTAAVMEVERDDGVKGNCAFCTSCLASSPATFGHDSFAPNWNRRTEDTFRPTHLHVARGGKYQRIGPAMLQTREPISDMSKLEIYRGEDGSLWARPCAEFVDGRFIEIKQEPKS